MYLNSMFNLQVDRNQKGYLYVQKLRKDDVLQLQEEFPVQMAYVRERAIFRMSYWKLLLDQERSKK